MTTAGEEWQEWLSHQTEFLSGIDEPEFWDKAMAKLKELQEKYQVGKEKRE